MSYNPEPGLRKERPHIPAWLNKYIAFHNNRPVAFWIRWWLIVVLISALTFVLVGPPDRLSSRLGLLFALVGWVIPFILWIKARKATH